MDQHVLNNQANKHYKTIYNHTGTHLSQRTHHSGLGKPNTSSM